ATFGIDGVGYVNTARRAAGRPRVLAGLAGAADLAMAAALLVLWRRADTWIVSIAAGLRLFGIAWAMATTPVHTTEAAAGTGRHGGGASGRRGSARGGRARGRDRRRRAHPLVVRSAVDDRVSDHAVRDPQRAPPDRRHAARLPGARHCGRRRRGARAALRVPGRPAAGVVVPHVHAVDRAHGVALGSLGRPDGRRLAETAGRRVAPL